MALVRFHDERNTSEVRLMTKFRNHSEFTQTAYLGGENGGG